MRTVWSLAAVCAVALGGLGVEPGREVRAQDPRRTPIVEAVQKTRDGIVTIKVDKSDGYGGTRDSTGTGVIVDERGYLVTSRHVVASAVRLHVRLKDGTDLPAKVVVEEKSTDLAILRVEPRQPLHALTLGPGSDLLVGETVIAVGNPFGYNHTVSRGIVSAIDREVTMPTGDVLTNLIQIDASINPGNSGGPLLNINGEVIGITDAIHSGAQGIAFAINVDTVKAMLSRHLNSEARAGTRHGLTCAEQVLPEGPHRQRVVVAAVAEETPAAQAGLKRGDEIRQVAGRSVANRFDVERALWDHKPGERIPISVLRHGKELAVALTLGGSSKRTSGSTPASRSGK
jgi:serine protease Do